MPRPQDAGGRLRLRAHSFSATGSFVYRGLPLRVWRSSVRRIGDARHGAPSLSCNTVARSAPLTIRRSVAARRAFVAQTSLLYRRPCAAVLNGHQQRPPHTRARSSLRGQSSKQMAAGLAARSSVGGTGEKPREPMPSRDQSKKCPELLLAAQQFRLPLPFKCDQGAARLGSPYFDG